MENELLFTPTDFVAIVNQVFETAIPSVLIEGEVANFRVAKGKWVYFDIKDNSASVKCFGTVYSLTMPIEDGMIVRVRARPQLHPLYNFSLQVSEITPKGEGSIKKAFEILQKKLNAEGLFEESRKRYIPYPPERIGLITSSESAAYSDFIKIINTRWPFIEIVLVDVQVQGTAAVEQIIYAISSLNQQTSELDVIVIIRGGGSADDLVVFQEEKLVRAVAASRVPTLVAIGHEKDISLSELVADRRASTPSNAAELLTPEINDETSVINNYQRQLNASVDSSFKNINEELNYLSDNLMNVVTTTINSEKEYLVNTSRLLEALNPNTVLKRGYAVVRREGKVVKSVREVKKDDNLSIGLSDGVINTRVVE